MAMSIGWVARLWRWFSTKPAAPMAYDREEAGRINRQIEELTRSERTGREL